MDIPGTTGWFGGSPAFGAVALAGPLAFAGAIAPREAAVADPKPPMR
jgi:hypothetical protein